MEDMICNVMGNGLVRDGQRGEGGSRCGNLVWGKMLENILCSLSYFCL